ncbi:MAG: hypothetical protein ACODAQ_00445 [Phycisphaeraceae bacterium]
MSSATHHNLSYAGLTCPSCGYDLRGLTAQRCPECGEPFDPRTLQPVPPWGRRPIVGGIGALVAAAATGFLLWCEISWMIAITQSYGGWCGTGRMWIRDQVLMIPPFLFVLIAGGVLLTVLGRRWLPLARVSLVVALVSYAFTWSYVQYGFVWKLLMSLSQP